MRDLSSPALSIADPKPRWRTPVLLATLLLLVAAVYFPAFHFGFLHYDDQTYVWRNPHVLEGFCSASFHYAFTATFGGWAPLVWFSYLIDHQLFDTKPGLMHLENAALHAVGGLLLYLFLCRATGDWTRSWIVAALFLCHPMHVESVAWIAERKDVLSTPLLLGVILCYLSYCRRVPGVGRSVTYCLMLFFFILSLMTKAMGVTLPLLLMLLDFWPLRQMPRLGINPASLRWVMEKLPLFAAAVVFSIISVITQRAAGATSAGAALPLPDRLGNAVVCYFLYAMKLLVPSSFAAFYPHPGQRPIEQVIAAGGLILLITSLASRYRKSAPYFIVGWLWFLISLLPVIGIIQVGGQAMADRYSYLPSIGIFLAVVWFAADAWERIAKKITTTISHGLVAAVVVSVLMMMVFIARRQVSYWKDDETLFAHSYQVTGPNPVVCTVLGEAAFSHGQFGRAKDFFTIVVSEDPGNGPAWKLLADLLVDTDLNRATDCYSRAVVLKPGLAEYHLSYAAALTMRGDHVSLELAKQQLSQALEIDPVNSSARAGFADVEKRLGKANGYP